MEKFLKHTRKINLKETLKRGLYESQAISGGTSREYRGEWFKGISKEHSSGVSKSMNPWQYGVIPDVITGEFPTKTPEELLRKCLSF